MELPRPRPLLPRGTEQGRRATLTYHLNALQGLDIDTDVCVTLNRPDAPEARPRRGSHRLRPPGLRRGSRSPRSVGSTRSMGSTARTTAAPTGGTASTRTACRARSKSAVTSEPRCEERDLHGRSRPSTARPSIDSNTISRYRCSTLRRSTRWSPPPALVERAHERRVVPPPGLPRQPPHEPRPRGPRPRRGAGRDPPEGPISLLAHLRTWGWLFNPIAVYYCYDRTGTRGRTRRRPRHEHPLEGAPRLRPGSGRQPRDRQGHARVALLRDGPRLPHHLRRPVRGPPARDRSSAGNSPVFHATLRLRRHEISRAALGRALWRHPLPTMRISAGIHTQALRLWAKGARFHPHPRQLHMEVADDRTTNRATALSWMREGQLTILEADDSPSPMVPGGTPASTITVHDDRFWSAAPAPRHHRTGRGVRRGLVRLGFAQRPLQLAHVNLRTVTTPAEPTGKPLAPLRDRLPSSSRGRDVDRATSPLTTTGPTTSSP